MYLLHSKIKPTESVVVPHCRAIGQTVSILVTKVTYHVKCHKCSSARRRAPGSGLCSQLGTVRRMRFRATVENVSTFYSVLVTLCHHVPL